MAYIFDLDQTLVDSSIAEQHRNQREWKTVFSMISQFEVYEGIDDVFRILHEKGEKICVVTSSPEGYCKAVLKKFGLQVDATVCYHDTVRHKPYPDPILKAIELLGENNQYIVSIGDADKDVIAAHDAGVISGLALWGREMSSPSVNADYVFETVEDLKKFIIT